MTKIQKFAAMSAAAVGIAFSPSVLAQDDLDDLLKELDSEAVASQPEPAPAAEEPAPAAEEPAPAPAAEEPAPAAEEPAPAAEEPAPAPAAEEPAPAPVAEEPAPAAEEPETTSLMAELANEAGPSVAAAAAPAKIASPDAELIENIIQTERTRRKALDMQAMRNIVEARTCMKTGRYEDAVRYFGNAEKLLGEGPQAKDRRDECEMGIASGLYRQALADWDLGLREKAMEGMMQARERRHPKAQRMLEKWQAEAAVAPDVTEGLVDFKHRKSEEEYKTRRELIRNHLRRSVQYLGLREMDKALEECAIVLVNDPYNEEALRIRDAIGKKRQVIREKERETTRRNMIADVDQSWRPAYTVGARKLDDTVAETVKIQAGEDSERTKVQEIERRMKEMRLPNVSFKPPATIADAVEFFRQASRDYDRPEIPADKRGFNFLLRTPLGAAKAQAVEEETDDFTANASTDDSMPTNGLEPLQAMTASDIVFYEALTLVCDSVGYKFIISGIGPTVIVMPKDMSIGALIARKYNVPDAFVERVSNATEDIKQMGGTGFGSSSRRTNSDQEEGGEDQDWKAFFEEMGVDWPEGSSIKHIKSLSKLYVRNTAENLAVFEKLLEELGAQTPLIEIETRFVEVSQEDLNSLGFEWILNSDYNLKVGNRLAKALNISDAGFVNTSSASSSTTSGEGTSGNNGWMNQGGQTATPSSSTGASGSIGQHGWQKDGLPSPNLGINAIGGVSDFSTISDADGNRQFSTGGRYLSTSGNLISGEGNAYNDQFMRVNAFLGNADLSMILHMLAQRSDTDLLSAPKVVTKSGENAIIKVVTEFIFPRDYDVQLQSSSSSSGNGNGGSQSAILAIVEPQNFDMREVGVILDVTPTYSEANGGIIDLELKPQVVDEPTWKNYGMKIPFTGNSSLENFEGLGGIFDGLANIFTTLGNAIPDATKKLLAQQATDSAMSALDNLSRDDSLTYYEAPMEQPFFHVRSIDSKVSITPGSTVVMGGLITEQRKAMDDKVPFFGDLPFVGRLFRSHAEQTIKRNLLIFVTGRLIKTDGSELNLNAQPEETADGVKAAPEAS